MDEFLTKVTQQAVNYAIRSGIAITTTYALRQSTRLIRSAEDGVDKAELQILQERLESKIKIISPAIDMIELISARGNSSLETAVSLTKSLRWDIQLLGQQITAAANEEEARQKKAQRSSQSGDSTLSLRHIIFEIKRLLSRIEDAVPLINLAITTSGASLSSALPSGISPSRLLQASTFVTAGDSQYAISPTGVAQIGPTFTLSLYMLFAAHARSEDEASLRQTTWKEVMHKARVKLVRVPLDQLYELPEPEQHTTKDDPMAKKPNIAAQSRTDEFAYQMLIIEDHDDGRVHTYEDDEPQPGQYGEVELAGIREPLPIHEISKIFYADTGKLLNIGEDVETNSPVLLLKRDVNAIPPRRMLEKHDVEDRWSEPAEFLDDTGSAADPDDQSEIDAQLHRESRTSHMAPRIEDPLAKEHYYSKKRIPKNLDPEWLAFEVFIEDTESDTESDEQEPSSAQKTNLERSTSVEPNLYTAMSRLKLETPSPASQKESLGKRPGSPSPNNSNQLLAPSTFTSSSPFVLPQIRTSLSLLETMLRLLSLQQFQQCSHLSIPDELLSFFLSEATSTTGAAKGDQMERQNIRTDARRRVGFDPYDESPIKRRGEDYQRYRGGTSQNGELDSRNAQWREELEGAGNENTSWAIDTESSVWSSPTSYKDSPGNQAAKDLHSRWSGKPILSTPSPKRSKEGHDFLGTTVESPSVKDQSTSATGKRLPQVLTNRSSNTKKETSDYAGGSIHRREQDRIANEKRGSPLARVKNSSPS